MKSVRSIFLLALMCLSCTPRESVPTRTISGQVVFEDVDAMMLLSATDSSVLVLNPSDTLLLGIYSPSGHQKFLRKGRGKYEVLNPSLSYCVHGHTMDFIDHAGFASSQPARMFSLDLSCPEDFSSWTVTDLSWIGRSRAVSHMVNIAPGKYLAITGRYESGTLLTLLDIRERTYTPLDYRIPVKSETESLAGDLVFNTSSIALSCSGTPPRIAYACGEGKYLEILNWEGESVSSRRTVFDVVPEFRAKEKGNVEMLDKENRGLRIRASFSRLFILYEHPVEMAEYKGYPFYYTDFVDVFDWEGNQLERLLFDIPFGDFVVTEDGRTLYTISEDKETFEASIRRYDLS